MGLERLLKHDARGMSSLQISTFLNGDPIVKQRPTLVRVVPRDRLKRAQREIRQLAAQAGGVPRVTVVSNTDPSSKPGRHWVAYYFVGTDDRSRRSYAVDFFCSYGSKSTDYAKDIAQFGAELCRLVTKVTGRDCTVRSNSTQIQSHSSAVCGHLSILFLLFRVRGHPGRELIK